MKLVFVSILFWIIHTFTLPTTFSLHLLDQNGNNIKEEDVSQITASIKIDSFQYVQVFDKPKVNFGITQIELTSGTISIGTTLSYQAFLENYFNTLKTSKKLSDSQFVPVEITVSLKNGKTLKFKDEIKFNDPLPLVKGNNDNAAIIDKSGAIFFDHRQNRFNNLIVNPEIFSFFNRNDSTILSSNKLWIFGDRNKTNFLRSSRMDFQGFRVVDTSSTGSLFSDGFDFTGKNHKFFFNPNQGIRFRNQSKNYEFSVFPDSMDMHGKTYDYSFDPGGFNIDWSRPSTIIKIGLRNDSGLTLTDTLKNTFQVLPNRFNLKQNGFQLWDLSERGVIFTPNVNSSFAYSNDILKIQNRSIDATMTPNGLFFSKDNLPGIIMGFNSETGDPFLVTSRLGAGSRTLHSFRKNTENGPDYTLNDPNAKIIMRLSTVAGTGGFKPFFYTALDGGAPLTSIFVDAQNRGVVQSTLKNFRMDHPAYQDKEIVYASLEGPEAGAYCRGKINLQNGKVFVSFPDHFIYVCGIEDMTIQLTPRSANSKGLAITEITEKGFLIEELFSGKGNYGVFWEAKGVRKGFEDYKVIRQKAEIQAAPINPIKINQ